MTETRRIIRVFLASPGDLQDERKAVPRVVEELNVILANRLGYQVELVGWEDTVSKYGRPQQIINLEVDRCDLFIGMMWKKWGTPPDNNGDYTSGFHEEFERATGRREASQKPEISLFFKEIDDEFLADKGPDLTRVLDFRNGIISRKSVLYQPFNSLHQIESLTRKCIADFLFCIRENELDEASSDSGKVRIDDNPGSSSGNLDDSSPISSEGFGFLEGFIHRIRDRKNYDTLSPCEIARFRLLANSVSKGGNDEQRLGAHDINILFDHRNQLDLGKTEITSLITFGFQNLHYENIPLWFWYSHDMHASIDHTIWSSLIGQNDDVKTGAIKVLTMLRTKLADGSMNHLNEKLLFSSWFSEKSSTRVKTAALDYTGICGCLEDVEVVRAEYELNVNDTSRKSLETMVRLLHRTGEVGSAEKLILNTQFDTMNRALLHEVLGDLSGVEIGQLREGLNHRNSDVRLRALTALGDRDQVTTETVKKCCLDNNAKIRFEALCIRESKGEMIPEDEVKKILVQPKKQPFLGSLLSAAPARSLSDSDSEGEEYFGQYQFSRLYKLSEKKLLESAGEALPLDDMAYFVLAEKYFSKHAAELRRNVDDSFQEYFEQGIQRARDLRGNAESDGLIGRVLGLEDQARRILTRRALDILCKKNKTEDRGRIRKNLQSGYAGASTSDARYLEKKGKWCDIQLLVQAEAPKSNKSILSLPDANAKGYLDAVARAVYVIGRNSFSELLDIAPSLLITERILAMCSVSVFRTITDTALFMLLNHKVASIRKATAMLAVQAFPKRRTTDVLNEYIKGDAYRYYNVIHWLDLGASMSRHESSRIVMAAKRKLED